MRIRFSVLAMMVLVLVACGAKRDRTVIAVIPKGTTHEFWKAIHAGALAAAKESDVDILWKGPSKEDELADQIKVVEDVITRRVQGIVLAPLNAQGLGNVVKEAGQAGIPVVIVDSDRLVNRRPMLLRRSTSRFTRTTLKLVAGAPNSSCLSPV